MLLPTLPELVAVLAVLLLLELELDVLLVPLELPSTPESAVLSALDGIEQRKFVFQVGLLHLHLFLHLGDLGLVESDLLRDVVAARW